MRTRLLIAALVAFIVLGIVVLRAFWPLPPVPLVVSKETAYFTGPLNPDGTVNYVAAFNNHIAAGSTPAENMAVPFIEAVGPAALSADIRDEAAALMNVMFSAHNPCFVRLSDHLEMKSAEYAGLVPSEAEQEPETAWDRRMNEMVKEALGEHYHERTPIEKLADSQKAHATTQPWSPDELSVLADWLAANDAVLDRISALERRTEFVVPTISRTNPSSSWLDPTLDSDTVRELAESLACRATLRLRSGDVAGAWDDALLMCYLGRLMTSPASGGQAFNGSGFRFLGSRIICLIAHVSHLTSAQATEMLRVYDALATANDSREGEILSLRLLWLDFVMQLARRQPTPRSTGMSISLPPAASFDLNNVMRRVNAAYDDLEAIVTIPDIHHRLERARQERDSTGKSISSLRERVKIDGLMDKAALILSSSTAKRKFANDALVWTALTFMPPFDIVTFDAQLVMHEQLGRIALALAAYHADHQRYPDSLTALAPDYLTSIPKDVFNGDDVHYESNGQGYRAWSVGEDLSNDGGDEQADIVVKTRH